MRILFRILQIVSILALLAVAVSAGKTFLFRPYVDFPCFVEFDQTRGCLDTANYYGPRLSDEPVIEVFLSRFEARSNGAWCGYDASLSDRLEMDSPLGSLEFAREGDGLLLNGVPLRIGEPYERSNYFILHPWASGEVRIASYGLVAPCGEQSPRLVAVGWAGTRVSIPKGVLLSLLWLAAIILFGRLAGKRK